MGSIAVVIPCYLGRDSVLNVLSRIGPEVSSIYVVDDACPQESGKHVQSECHDPRVRVVVNPKNLGVGGATMNGLRAALADGHSIMLKLDADGQMDPALVPMWVAPIQLGLADYVKGNRFYSPMLLGDMPLVRLIGNAALSFVSKLSSGYWNVMDPTNGFVAIERRVVEHLDLDRIDKRYFFESDMLFRLSILRAVVVEIPHAAVYTDHASSLRVRGILIEFPLKHIKCLIKRIIYNYYVRDFNLCSLQLLLGIIGIMFGVVFGSYHWISNAQRGALTSTGTVMLAVIPLVLGFQLLISAIMYDVLNVPRNPIHRVLPKDN